MKNKSSASAGTRKKNARKAAKGEVDLDEIQPKSGDRPQRGQKKLSKAQKKALPKLKQYIPPPKPPAPPIPDPLDGLGLARTLPAELVVVLRRLGKKDDVTRRKGLEELRENWVSLMKSEDDDLERELKETALLSSVPVWLHFDILSVPSLRHAVIESLSLSLLPQTQNRDVIGSWMVAALEEGKRAGGAGLKSWDSSTTWTEEGGIVLSQHLGDLVEYLTLSILDPATLHDNIHPAPVSSNPPVPNKGKPLVKEPAVEDKEVVEERLARYKVGGLTGLNWLIQQLPGVAPEDLVDLIRNPELWSALSPDDAPPIRRAAYSLLATLVETCPELLEGTLKMLSHAVLGNCWLEKEGVVWETAGMAVAKFIRKCWAIGQDAEDDESDSGEPEVYGNFLEFVSTICPSIPHLTYPILLVIISTLPTDLLPLSSTAQVENLFSHLWAPVDSRLLSTHSLPGQQSAFQVFISSILDCTVFLISKSWSSEESKDTAVWLVREQLGGKVWKEGVLEFGGKGGGRRAQRSQELEATAFGKAIGRLPGVLLDELSEIMTLLEVSARSIPIASAIRASTDVQGVVEIADECIEEVAQSATLASSLPPDLFVSLLASAQDTETLRAVLQSDQRFALVPELLNTNLLQPGSLDSVATDSTQLALSGSSEALAIATSCLKSPYLSSEALDEVLALVCTAIHDSTEKLLTGHAEDTHAAFTLFAAYAIDHLDKVISSDIWIQSLVSVHHVVHLLPKDETLVQLWKKTGELEDGDKKRVLDRVYEALREDIQRVEVEVDPAVLIDVALATAMGDLKAPSVLELSEVLLPPIETLIDEMSLHTCQPSHPSLPIVDPMIDYSKVTPDITADFDLLGRSKAARWAEATVALLRADRQLVASQPILLQVALAAYQLTKDTLAVPGSSRGLYSTSASIVHLTDLVREVEGALSYALSFVDETPASWHNDIIQMLKSGEVSHDADLLQKLLFAMKDGDVRSFRDVLIRHLRQCAPQLALAIIYAVKPLLLDHKSFSVAQNRLANALTSVKADSTAVTKQGIPYIRLLIASAPPADAASVFLPQQRAIFVLRHVNSWLIADDDMPEEIEYRIAELETALAPIVQDLPGGHWDAIFDLIESGLDLSDLIRLSTSSAVQCAAYRILSRVVKHNTLALVLEVEAAEAEEGHPQIELPQELIKIAGVLSQLLAWMGILDHFDDAVSVRALRQADRKSRTLRWAYLDQLNSSKLITDGLLPMLFTMLGVSEVGAWNFPAMLDPEDMADLTPLASHLFYRSLVTIPSALRGYYESLKSRQLSMSMLTFVARHYSPVIISHEFAALRQPSAMAQLTEEGLNIRIAQGGGATVAVAGGGSSEAIASYVVDEQPMEIGIRLPAEFPLKAVDNGLILEALTVFKRNVSLHFEGVVECAICYSIISLTDRTLPTKPCRTCKNRFHASCLFKWFNSSHSSSCPLCRALF
ncbi:uncharacterized protein IL334_005402 [Kwoniella shivajii]|uniref:E3 ubiquitin-protein ligase listerin n=1 Tax=Kwoniella shivajii TaxID=564305 RepID=A0ABZ1D322_9TREE|nr:hypothetical protein IL334_005402 [Kwoniella shivajii]